MNPAIKSETLRIHFMKFILEIGETEKHVVEFSFNQLLGSLVIRVDNKTVVKSQRLFNEPVHEVYNLKVGQKETAAVRIEKQRKPLFGHRNRVFVDNRLAQVFNGC